MGKLKVFIYFALFLITNKVVGQIDSVAFRFEPGISTLDVKCIAQKVKITATDTIYTDFNASDTVNSAYTFDWGGTTEPLTDGLFEATYDFPLAGNYTFNLSVFETSSGTTFTTTQNNIISGTIIVPNVFTPNFDNVNDLFVVKSDGIRTLDISIYSRTGTLVYHTKSPIIVWDGRNTSGKIVSPGIYFYVLTSDDPSIDTQKGFFYVLYKPEDIKGK